MLDKALYELTYELNNRPDWVRIPLAGLLNLSCVVCSGGWRFTCTAGHTSDVFNIIVHGSATLMSNR